MRSGGRLRPTTLARAAARSPNCRSRRASAQRARFEKNGSYVLEIPYADLAAAVGVRRIVDQPLASATNNLNAAQTVIAAAAQIGAV